MHEETYDHHHTATEVKGIAAYIHQPWDQDRQSSYKDNNCSDHIKILHICLRSYVSYPAKITQNTDISLPPPSHLQHPSSTQRPIITRRTNDRHVIVVLPSRDKEKAIT